MISVPPIYLRVYVPRSESTALLVHFIPSYCQNLDIHNYSIYVSAATYEPEGEDIELQMKLLTMLDNPAVIVAAAASGDVDTLRDFLRKHPSQVYETVSALLILHKLIWKHFSYTPYNYSNTSPDITCTNRCSRKCNLLLTAFVFHY